MPTVDEAAGSQPTQLTAALRDGLQTLALDQEIEFTLYNRVVLPLDGYVFWVNAGVLSESAVFNASVMNAFAVDAPAVVEAPAPTMKVLGSLHYSIERRQQESDTISVNRVVFTSEKRIENLDTIGPLSLYVAEFEGLRFAFSQRGGYYRQADLHHYVGDAVYPDMATQLVDDPGQLDVNNVIVSNSLPLWLRFSGYAPTYGIGNPYVQFYPSFLLPPNLYPPYGVIHIAPDGTEPLQAIPSLGPRSQHHQFYKDRVRMTLVGLRNHEALDVLDCVIQYSRDYGHIGIMNTPAVRDEKRTQDELSVIAQRKTIDFEVSYWQQTARNIARQLIYQALATVAPVEPALFAYS